ncbi:MAG: type II secretion system protein N [Alphaproteobacteria bacterium]|nr:hypothetical protein [Hyphomonas sp.]MBR9807400.1 type II secretion system protein N [Alphaproteobacteria bacterium]
MMRLRTFQAVVFSLCLLGGLVAFAPLSFAMRQSGLTGQGIGWQQARGSIWSGQVTGIVWKGQPVGAVDLQARPGRIFSGIPMHEARWSGPAGQGQALVGMKGRALNARDVSASLYLDHLKGIDPSLSNLGSTVRLSNAHLVMEGERCKAASGTITTNLARLAAVTYDRDWPILSGSISCEQGELGANMIGQADDGTVISFQGKLLTGLRLEIETLDEDLRGALKLAGFKAEGTKLVYARQAERQERLQ